MKILFAGTPEIAVPLLSSLSEVLDVVAVLTSPDKPVGRSKQLQPSPVKAEAQRLGIPVLQFDSLRTEARQAVRETGADTLVTFAFGKIFGPKFLALFDRTFNVHPSALPLLRGPSPIQHEILYGFKEAVISLQTISEKMDEGDIWATTSFDLDGTENTLTLTQKVASAAATFVPQVLCNIDGCASHVQEGSATYCTMIDSSMAVLDFNKPASELHALVRAMYPWPKARAHIDGREIMITSVYGGFKELENQESVPQLPAGSIFAFEKKKGLGVVCKDSVLWINGLQLPSKKELDHVAFVNGNSWIVGARFDE